MLTLSGGEKFRIARRRAGLTQTQVGRLIGRPQNAVARWERGDRVPAYVWREAGLIEPGELVLGEIAMLLRERRGLTVDQARGLVRHGEKGLVPASEGGQVVSHVYVLRMEAGRHTESLRDYVKILEKE